MRLRRRDARDRRALILGAVVILGLVVGGSGIPRWRAWTRAEAASAMELDAELQRAERSVAGAPAMAESLAVRNARLLAMAPAIVTGDTPALAAGNLASLLSGVAAAAGMRVTSVQPRADTSRQGTFVRVAVRASLVGDVRGLTRMLAALERGPTRIAVRELSISQPEPGAGADRVEALRVELDSEGLAIRHASAKEKRR